MVSFGPRMLCTDAEPYYYDHLCGLDAGIPQTIAHHIRHCAHCGAQIRQLEAAIAESETDEHRPHGGPDVIDALSLHFAHLGEDVTCAKVKPFLPALLLPSLEIRIPTPITVHMDHCRQCTEDLESIRELGLRPEQLARLSRLYAALPSGDSHLCRQARAKTWAFASASFEGIDAAALDHMCVCPRCRRRVYRRRERILAGRQPGDTIPGVALCSGISMTDLFEWVMPYGRSDGDLEQSSVGDEGIPSHLQACPECIERMQALHRTIYGIAERVDSGVSTVYTAATGAQEMESRGQTESLYSGYPIHVESAHHEPAAAVTRFHSLARARAALQRGAAHPQFRPFMKAAMLAAVMIPLAIVLLVNTRSASGVSIRELSRALKHVENVHVLRYGQDTTEPVQQVWLSRASKWIIMKRANEQSLYDTARREQRIVHLNDGTTETVRLTPDRLAGVDSMVDNTVEFVRTGVPAGMESQPLTREPDQDTEGSEAYALIWSVEFSHGFSSLRKLQIFLDSDTRLPRKVVVLQRMPDEEQWHEEGRSVFEYPSQEAMDLAASDMFGRR